VSNPPFTVGCRFRANNATADGVLIDIADSDDSPTVFKSFRLQAQGSQSGDPILGIAHNPTQVPIAQTSTGFTAGTWHTAVMAMTHNGTSIGIAVYIDGGSKGVQSSAFTLFTPDRITLGAVFVTDGGVTAHFNGSIADAFVVNRVLTDREVASYHQSKSIDSVIGEGVKAVYRLHNGDSDRDWYGKNHLTAVNSPTYTQHPGGIVYPGSF
jgi:hypothetical protein